MRVFMMVLISLGWISLTAQADFQADDLFRVGDSGSYLALDAANVEPGPAGSNVRWDFSQLSRLPGEDFELLFDLPGATPNAAAYPQADLITQRTEGDSVAVDYLQFRNNRFFVLGSEVSDVGVFSFAEVSFFAALPLAFGESRTNPIAGSYDFASNLGPSGTSTLLGEASATYDGFGEIVLPDGRQLAVNRVVFVREWDESGSIAGSEFSAHQKETRYLFFEQGHSAPVFELINTEQVVTPTGAEPTTQITAAAAYRASKNSKPGLTAARGAHLTNPGGGFDSQIIIHNPTDSVQTPTLQPFAGDGTPLDAVPLSLAAHTTLRVQAQNSFSSEAKSFLVNGCDACVVSVGYRADIANASIAQVHQTQNFRREFTFYPGEWQVLFDGQALVNISERATAVTASQYDFAGELLARATLETALQPGGKHLSLLNDTLVDDPNSIIRLHSDEPLGVMVLRISKDARFLYQNNPLPVSVSDRGRWLAHITSETGGFESDILVHNRADSSQTINFQPYQNNGDALDPVEVTLAANSTVRYAKTQLFPGETSHVAISGSSECIASVGYRAKVPQAGTAMIHEAAPVGKSFGLYPGEWEVLYDGIALVNTGNEPTTITLNQIDDNGNLLNTVVLAADLPPNAKFLGLLEGLIDNHPNSIISVEAAQPLALLSLRLSKDNLHLYNNETLPQ